MRPAFGPSPYVLWFGVLSLVLVALYLVRSRCVWMRNEGRNIAELLCLLAKESG